MDQTRRTASVFAVVILVVTAAVGGTVFLAGLSGPASAQQGTPISGCQSITQPGTYELTSDIDVTGPFNFCIAIRSSDVTLLGNGHVVDGGEQGTGIFVNPDGTSRLSNVEIRNVRVRDWNVGVAFSQVDGGTLQTSTISDANNFGVLLSQVSGSEFFENTFRSNGYGILGAFVGNNRIQDNTFQGSTQAGVFLSNAVGNRLERNRYVDNRFGVEFLQASNNRILQSTARDNDEADVVLRQSSGNAISSLRSFDSTVSVSIRDSNDNDVNGVTAGGQLAGVLVENGDGNTIRNSALSRMFTGVGIGPGSENNTVRNVSSAYNDVGFYQEGGSNNTYRDSTVTHSTVFGTYLVNTSGNTFTRNVVTATSQGFPAAGTPSLTAAVLPNETVNASTLATGGVSAVDLVNPADLTFIDRDTRSFVGLQIEQGTNGDGMRLENADANAITDNVILRNVDDGIEIDDSDDNAITDNTICENGGQPVNVDADSTGNVVQNNDLDC